MDSVFIQDYKDFEVIVIDNGSVDYTVSILKEYYPEVFLIENRENLGSCAARNKGIEASKGKWILTLDCDVVLERNFLGKAIKFSKSSGESIGIFQPKILNSDKDTIYSSGIRLTILRRFYDIACGKPDNGKYDKLEHIFGACSAAGFYRKKILEEIKEKTGYFDERFFFLVEDVDLAWRAQKKGWKAFYYPGSVCYHSGNSSGFNKRTRQYLCFRNRYYMILKNENKWCLYLKLILCVTYDVPRFFYLILTNPYTLKGIKEVANYIKKL